MTVEDLEALLEQRRIVPSYIRGHGKALKLPDACRMMELSVRTYYNLQSAGAPLPPSFTFTGRLWFTLGALAEWLQ